MPGSPPTKINEPLTIPPPRTLSNSFNPVFTLTSSFPLTSLSFSGLAFFKLSIL